MRLEEFDIEKAWWNNRTENDFAWKVSVEDIKKNNYNLDVKNPRNIDPTHREPSELLAEYEAATEQMQKTQNQLKDILAEALSRHVKSEAA